MDVSVKSIFKILSKYNLFVCLFVHMYIKIISRTEMLASRWLEMLQTKL